MVGRGYICGRSGSGKSNGGKYIHTNVDPARALAVYVNPHNEHVPRSKRVHNLDQLIAAAKAGSRKIEWRLPPLHKDPKIIEAVQGDLSSYWDWIQRAGGAASKDGRPVGPWIVTTFGEAHKYAPINGGYTAVDAMLCEGRKFGARTIIESQRPQQVTSEALEQADWIMVFRLKKAGWKYLKDKGIPVKEFDSHVRKKYHFVMVDDDLWTPYGKLPNMD